MQHLAHLLGIEKDVCTPIVRQQKTITVRMSLNSPWNQTGAFRQDEGALPVTHELRFTLHGHQTAFKQFELAFSNIKQIAKPFEEHRTPLILKDLQNVFARRKRHRIPRCFAFEIWILFSCF